MHPPGATGAPAESFSTEEAVAHVRVLAGDIGARPAGSKRYRRAVRWVQAELAAVGYHVRLQSFRLPQGGRSWNVVVRWPASGPVVTLIGAHLDTVIGSPGANDNASGVAALLETGRAIAGTEETDGLALVAFGAEELQPNGDHHIGSAAYVRRMRPPQRRRLDMMVSVDMVGKVHPFIAARLEGTSGAAARALVRAAREVGLPARTATLGDISDHGPFAAAGVPAALLWTGWEPNHHRPTDVVSNVQPRALDRAGRVLVALLGNLP